MTLREELFVNQDVKYRDFNAVLIPNVEKDLIIGVRLPILRKIAKKYAKNDSSYEVKYFEEKMVYGLSIGCKKQGIDEYIKDLKNFVPMIDNWAVCDSCCTAFKFTNRYRKEMFDFVKSCLNKSEYETRFAVVMLMDYYLTDDYIDCVLDILSSVKSEFYYVNMAVAWALSVAYVKYKDKVLPILKSDRLDVWTHNKTIQKIRESYRIEKEEKEYLKTLKK